MALGRELAHAERHADCAVALPRAARCARARSAPPAPVAISAARSHGDAAGLVGSRRRQAQRGLVAILQVGTRKIAVAGDPALHELDRPETPPSRPRWPRPSGPSLLGTPQAGGGSLHGELAQPPVAPPRRSAAGRRPRSRPERTPNDPVRCRNLAGSAAATGMRARAPRWRGHGSPPPRRANAG